MTDLGPTPSLLVPHCVRCAFREAPVVCTRCHANEYCSEIHQKDDTQRHRKGQCKAVLEARDKLRDEAETLRATTPDGMFLPDDVFQTGVGDFYAIHETRAYMAAKRALVVELANVGSHSGIVNALEEASDALRLDEQDHMAFREPVPAFLILLGRFQDAYDVIRYWATHENDDNQDEDDDMDESLAPCFRTRGADMTESLDVFQTSSTVSVLHLCALTFLKLLLRFGIRGAIQHLAQDDPSAQHAALAFLRANGLPTDIPFLTKLEQLMAHHAIEAFFMLQERDKFVWYPIYMPKMINPAVHPWLTAYADMYHWFPPALEAVYQYGTKSDVATALAAYQAP